MYTRQKWISLALLLVFGSILLFRTPRDASNLEIVPDSIEYAFGAQHLANGDGYYIQVGGRNLPPRYPPWFSLALVPAYWTFGSDPGNGIIIVFGFAMIGLIAAFELGWRISGIWGGVGAGVLLLAATDYHYWGRQIMSDVPCTALVLVLLWIWFILQESSTRRLPWCLAGILLGLGTAFRPTTFAFVLPFLFSWMRQSPRRWVDLAGLTIPCAILFALSGYYNQLTFGSFERSGYSYWCAVPYDYRNLLYSLRYVPGNIYEVWNSNGIWLAAGLLVSWLVLHKRIIKSFSGFLVFVLLGSIPFLLFYLVYFYPDARFYLPLSALMAVGFGGVMGTLFQGRSAHLLFLGQIAMIVAGLWMATQVRRDPHLARRQIADSILRETPPDAAIVTAIEPAYLENFPSMGDRQIVPVSRKVEYASKVLVRKKIPNIYPEPAGWWDHHCPGLLEGGAEEVASWTAYEYPGQLAALAASGRPLFFDRTTVGGNLIAEIVKQAQLSGLEQTGEFYRLSPDLSEQR